MKLQLRSPMTSQLNSQPSRKLAAKILSGFVLALAFVGFMSGCQMPSTKSETSTPQSEAIPYPMSLDEALTSPFRTASNLQRDQYRHPKETLNFFGIMDTMTVIEVSPGAGWYAEILIPYLAPKGKYIAAAVPVSVYAGGQKFVDYVKSRPEFEGKVTIADFAPPKIVNIAEPGSADMVLTFRNVHNWMKNDGQAAAFKAFFEALKPGGILGVVEHRENPNKKDDPKATNGYVKESQVIQMAKAAGFQLVNRSEINANPKDTKDYEKGVWTLPPSFREGDKDREKYTAIGESDRMTLKFIKPTLKR